MVIEVESALRVPEIFCDPLAPLLGTLAPLLSLRAMAKLPSHPFEIFLLLVKQTVQPHGRIIRRCRAEGAEFEGDIKAGFAKAAVALVKGFRKPNAPCRVAILFDQSFCGDGRTAGIANINREDGAG